MLAQAETAATTLVRRTVGSTMAISQQIAVGMTGRWEEDAQVVVSPRVAVKMSRPPVRDVNPQQHSIVGNRCRLRKSPTMGEKTLS